jgi:uncharacterized protein (DUF58 family)
MTRIPLTWHGSGHQWRLAVVTAVALGAAVLTGQSVLLALAAPPMVFLGFAIGRGVPRTVALEASLDATRCFEGEEIRVAARAVTGEQVDLLSARLVLPPELEVVDGRTDVQAIGADALEAEWRVRARRWGRQPIGVRVHLRSTGRLREAIVERSAGELVVHPRPVAASADLVPTELLAQLGEHLSRAAGEGVQFAGIRGYVPGDRARSINWFVSSRRDRLHVNTYAVERAANLVVMVDAFSDVGPAGDSTLDRSLRGATALARVHLKVADRVGVIAVGGALIWLGADLAARHYHRIAELLLSVRREPTDVPAVLTYVPRAALPPGAMVVLFSPLLEASALDVVWGLGARGHPVVVVDVLSEEPRPPRGSRGAELALRLYRLDRAALRYRLAEHGIAVVRWDATRSLGVALAPLARRPLMARRA